MSAQRDGDLWVPNPHSLLFLQCDPRNVLVLFRKGPGELVLPPRGHFIGLLVVLSAGWVRLWLEKRATSFDGAMSEFFDPARADHLIWVVFAVLLFVVSAFPARENGRRRYEEQEIHSLKYVGWPRLIDAHKFYALSPKLQRRRWRRVTFYAEPAIGVSVACLTALVSWQFGLWLAMNMLLLFGSSRRIVRTEREMRLDYEAAYFHMACQKRLLDEVMKKRKRRRW